MLRVFNDAVGVELTHRTGKNPNYHYVQIGCSKSAERAMLAWAQRQVGKPFSSMGMLRSMVWPRTTDNSSFYCAELVAACLKVGGLMTPDSNPGNATPASLHALYRTRGAVQGNPYTLRREFAGASGGAGPAFPLGNAGNGGHARCAFVLNAPAVHSPRPLPTPTPTPTFAPNFAPVRSRRPGSPPKQHFVTLQTSAAPIPQHTTLNFQGLRPGRS